MANKKIEHPLRTIELTYDELTPFHPFEEEMLDRYTTLHNFVKELCEEYSNIQQKYEDHDIHIKRVIARFRAIKTRMHHLNISAKSLLNRMIPEKAEIDKVIAEGKEFKMLLNSFNDDVERLSAESTSMHEIFLPLDSKDEQLAEIFKEYRAFRGELAGNQANCSLDFEQYDNDEQAFLSSLNDMSARQTQFIGICNTVIDRYNFLVAEVEKTLEEWEKTNKILDMVSLLGVTPHDITRICLN
jgi:chromosome segregation ATPase